MQAVRAHVRRFDHGVLVRLERRRDRWSTRLARFASHTATSRAWIIVAAALASLAWLDWQILPRLDRLRIAMIPSLLAWVVGSIVKRMVGRPRPTDEGHSAAIEVPPCRSFPSSHAASTFAFAMALFRFGHPWAAFAGAWAVLVAFSRCLLGVHYPSDVIGGAGLGAACGLLATDLGRWLGAG